MALKDKSQIAQMVATDYYSYKKAYPTFSWPLHYTISSECLCINAS
jgi:hypothetical protein